MVEQIRQADFFITGFINNIFPHNPFFDALFSFFSIRGVNTVFWVILGLIWIFIAEKKSPGIQKKDKRFIILFSVSLLITAFLVNIVFKNLVGRPRPYLTANCPSDFSFPSSHAAIAFAATVILSAFDKKRKYFYYFVASLIALSRIYLGCHYLFDILVGTIFGYLISKLILLFGNKLTNIFTKNG